MTMERLNDVLLVSWNLFKAVNAVLLECLDDIAKTKDKVHKRHPNCQKMLNKVGVV